MAGGGGSVLKPYQRVESMHRTYRFIKCGLINKFHFQIFRVHKYGGRGDAVARLVEELRYSPEDR